MDDFVVGAQGGWGPVIAVAVIVGAAIAFRAAAAQFSGARLLLARVILLFGVVGAAFAGYAETRDLVRVTGETIDVVWPYTFESGRYTAKDVRWFAVQNREVGISTRSHLEPYLLMYFSDDGYTEIPMKLPNAQRLRNFLQSRGVHEGVIVE